MKVVVQQRQPWFECVISPGCRLSTGVRVTGGTGNDTAGQRWSKVVSQVGSVRGSWIRVYLGKPSQLG
ncbi:hypothetical protein HanRHA438_Chr02g0047971 [Helianthus annuus]|uniref:Uncharacterized protein n=1 Tax=Helianthus annuus TaxID=4232 RepID=A0A9K3JKI8_HELAN|nr:hypothetical protein HanXRQr2_Chr02g0046881 [Helianthus annuus]KAJ0938271.1 hypothetical protein HanRHA438_Chr02g0047971 [Helianthus annuus]KAJ0950288.1 hypothetical protein HanPSC8_Chr02g0046471 [Helianthus annuus]